jgi:5-methylcytosine-specific restriction endonuclease McrA
VRRQVAEGSKRTPTGDWGRLRRQVLARDRHTCQMCRTTAAQLEAQGEYLEVHHRDGDSNNNDLSNLQALCRVPCHRQIAQPAVRRERLARSRRR